jgi:putative sigma-54 modulation protein
MESSMRFIISGRGVSLSPAFRALVERKVGKLSRILPKILEAKVMLSAEKYRRTAELTLLAKRKIFRSGETASDLATAVDLAVETLGRQVRQEKDRISQRKSRMARKRRPAGAPRSGVEPSELPGVVSRRVASKPMSVEEAVMQLGLSPDQFLVFTNVTSRTVNVLYRRNDDSFGLIGPVA